MKSPSNINERTEWINENATFVINSLNRKAIDDYTSIQKTSNEGFISRNESFKTAFKNFYGMPQAHLGKDFENLFFEIFQRLSDNRNNQIKIEKILKELYDVKTKKEVNTIQFSFVSKMIHTIDNEKPIYDKMIRILFNFPDQSNITDFEKKIDGCIKQYNLIQEEYKKIIEFKLVDKPLKMFGNRFNYVEISEVKKLDFIYWVTGRFFSSENDYFKKKNAVRH